MKALELLGDEASFEAILPLVEAPHFENRGFAEPLLQLFGRVATSEQLIRVLDQSIYPEVRAAAVEALAHYHHPEARAALQRALYDEVAWVRNQALIVLAHKVSREQLLAAIADEDEQVRATALRLLQEVDPDALAPVIEEASAFLLGQGSGQVIGSLVQRSIASAISELGRAPADLVAYVGELLDWPHLDVQREAAQALGKLRRNVPDRAIEKLLALRRTSIAPLVRRAADDTLSEILSLETGIEDDA
jgi:HEAT repeat protein